MALINVSMLLTVREIESKIIIIDKLHTLSFKSNEKKAKSGITLLFADTEIKPQNPIKNTIGIIVKNEITKLFFKTSLFLAA